MTSKWQKRGNLKKETDFFIETQNVIKSKYIKATIDNTQLKSKCRLYGDKDETVNRIVCEYYRLAQKEFKTVSNWVGKVICWKLWKILKFDLATKWYMHKAESVLENKIWNSLRLWNTLRRRDKVLIHTQKRNSSAVDFAVRAEWK